MQQHIIRLQPLTAAAFAPFGDVLQVSEHNTVNAINYGHTDRHHQLARVDTGGGEAIISIFRSRPVELPLQITLMERHPLGSQAFMPLSGRPYVVVVAPPGELDPGQIHGFLASANQGVNYHTGTWHHYCLSLQAESDFLVVDRSGPGHNCDEVTLPADCQFILQAATN